MIYYNYYNNVVYSVEGGDLILDKSSAKKFLEEVHNVSLPSIQDVSGYVAFSEFIDPIFYNDSNFDSVKFSRYTDIGRKRFQTFKN